MAQHPSDPQDYDHDARQTAEDRLRQLAVGLLPLPNLVLRSAATLALLYCFLGLVLISLVQFGNLSPLLAVAIGGGIIVLQFLLGPWLMDLSLRWFYKMRWADPEELPDHLRTFVGRVCEERRMKFPSFGLIDDGAPTAFTYGHHPNNARIVISRGMLELLTAAEAEAVVAHELGHACHWDMAMMTIAQLVPLLLYYLYRTANAIGDRNDKAGGYTWVVALGAYVLYVVTEYVVLWFSRTREYYADRFAGEVTGNPSALANALVKIAYGLAAQVPGQPTEEGNEEEAKKAKKKPRSADTLGALGALNIFNRQAAVGMVMASAGGTTAGPDKENIKSAMQWDLWNPWATYYELHSTHPLVAKRLLYLTDQAAQMGQEPYIVFDRRKPESYWDDFLIDLGVMMLPGICLVAGLVAAGAVGLLTNNWPMAGVTGGVALVLLGLALLVKTRFQYRSDLFPQETVATLLHKVKVSGIRPVPATLQGSIIGKGVPGLVWSEDFVLQDPTGIIFTDYQQPLAIWNFLFGLLKAGAYQGKEVRVTGWFRRAPVPYLEVRRIEVLDGSLPDRNCYSYPAQVVFAGLLTVLGVALTIGLLL